jgi:HK97 family phage prohead protease
MIVRKEKAAPPPSADVRDFVMSDGQVDRMGDVIEPAGWQLDEFNANPVALFGHDARQVIGKWEQVRVEKGQLRGRLVLGKDDPRTPEINKVRALVEQGFLRAVSVGFSPIEKQPLDDKADKHWGPFRFLKSRLLECSLVAVPANPRALAVAKSLGLSSDTIAEVFRKPADEHPAPHAKPGKSLVPKGTTMQTISQKIQTGQKRIVAYRDQLAELATKDDLDDDEMKLTKEIPDLIEAEEAEVQRLERIEKAVTPKAGDGPKPAVPAVVQAEPLQGQILLPRKKIDPVDCVFRAMSVSVKSFGTQTPLEAALREMYGADESTGWMIKAAVNPAQTTVAGYAAELVNTGYGGLMDRLLAGSLYGPLSAAGSRFDFGANGQIKIPVRSTTPRAAGAWVGEGAPKPVKRIGLTQITLSPRKLAVITTFTEEMAFYSTPAIEGVLRKAMADDTREALDGFLIDNVAASATRPAGLLNGVTPNTPSAAATPIGKIVADINGLIAPMEAAGGGGNVVLLMNPAEARKIGMAQTTTGDFAFTGPTEAAGKFGVKGIITSTIVTAGTVIAVDADWFTTAVGDTPRFAVSNEATLHEEDTTPLALGTTGTPNVVAAPMRSLFQTDSIAIRLSLYVTWAMTRTGMVQVVPGVAW